MHRNNRRWLADLREAYPQAFTGSIRVLELGSRDINGTPREFFNVGYYLGVDVADGPGVDMISAAKDMMFEDQFDVLICLSMLEHDPDWRESLCVSARVLRENGLLFLAFGAEGNVPHEEDIMPFVELKHAGVISEVLGCGYEIIDAFLEEDRYGSDCRGCYNLIGKKAVSAA